MIITIKKDIDLDLLIALGLWIDLYQLILIIYQKFTIKAANTNIIIRYVKNVKQNIRIIDVVLNIHRILCFLSAPGLPWKVCLKKLTLS